MRTHLQQRAAGARLTDHRSRLIGAPSIRSLTLAALLILILLAMGASDAAAGEAPRWVLTATSDPTNIAPASALPSGLIVTATNVGGASTDGSKITLEDSLPPGFTATEVAGDDAYGSIVANGGQGSAAMSCSQSSPIVCTYSGRVDPGDRLSVWIGLGLASGLPATVVNQASVTGGGPESVSRSTPITISDTPAAFGPVPGSVFAALSTTQAGGHPNVTTAFTMDTGEEDVTPYAKDFRFDFTPGLVGTAVGMPQCTMVHVVLYACPSGTMVGMAILTISLAPGGLPFTLVTPIYNIAPAPGEPVAFGFDALFFPVRLDTSVLSDGNYGVRVTAPNVPQAAMTLSTSITIWGIPSDHNGPGEDSSLVTFFCGCKVGGPDTSQPRVALLSNPQQCSEPLNAVMEADAWSRPDVFESEEVSMGSLTGCGLLGFSASASMLPDTLQAGAPAGYSFDLNVPQKSEAEGLVTPTVKRVVTTLPMGTVVSPSSAWGLTSCSDAQFGLHTGVPGGCPRESQVGTVSITTPALPQPLTGEVFLASPECGVCSPEDAQSGKMVRLFVQVVGEGESRIVVKLEGTGQINQQTGQLSVTFDKNPPLPFSEFKLTLGGGSRATLANPRTCNVATTTVDLTPWSSPLTPDATPTSSFEPTGCYAAQFNPSFVAGTTNIQAGEYSPFTVSFGRGDPDEFLNGLQMQMPPGMLGSLSGIPLCKEQEASMGTCSQASLIGHTQVLTGPGQTPFLVTGGQVFLTEGYKGAPFGLSIVVPAKAGPYTLSGTTGTGMVVVRAAINIDPHTAALTVTSDPLPTALDGIPLQLRVVNVTIDRPGFTLNPTSCAKMAITGTLSSKESPGVTVSSPFQVTNCQGLGFKPQFKVATSGHTSRANGASLDAKVIYPAGAKLANIAKVKVDLPKQLPSRLTTLQKACPAAIFQANPGGCPSGSVVGTARASTPILPVGLSGPVYFVSHGGEAFPNLIVVLQGYGVRVDLIGDTFINKAGITSSTFNQVPDVPISSFELYLPEGPHSALAANGNLCKSHLAMPTLFVAQNGMTIKQSTKIAVTGCGKTNTGRRATKVRRARKASRRVRIKAGQTTSSSHGGHGRGNR